MYKRKKTYIDIFYNYIYMKREHSRKKSICNQIYVYTEVKIGLGKEWTNAREQIECNKTVQKIPSIL